MPKHASGSSFITAQQAEIHATFLRHRSLSEVARILGLSQIRVREALVQYQRNRMRDEGLPVQPLREMLRGDVVTRFGVKRIEFGGRPAKHMQADPIVSGDVTGIAATARGRNGQLPVTVGHEVKRWIVTAIETGAPVHRQFWANLKAYAKRVRAEIVVLRLGATGLVDDGADGIRAYLHSEALDIAGVVDVAADLRIPLHAHRPLESVSRRRAAEWTLIGHRVIQLETLPRMRADGLRVQMTTGVATLPPKNCATWPAQLGAVIVELGVDGHAHCRHILADPAGDGSFQDLTMRVRQGGVVGGCRVAALNFGDVHHAYLDPTVARMTWGLSGNAEGEPSLVDTLRPGAMIFHDLCDFAARNRHNADDHHQRFALMVAGKDCVKAEMEASARFLEAARRPWSTSVVVGSNHDDLLVHWLREADFREDPRNAVFFLEASLTLHRRLEHGADTDGLFEQVLRSLSVDGLEHVRFLATDESFNVSGIECGLHGHKAADGKKGGMPFFEGLGIMATLGHTHRPTTRGGICCAGVCQSELAYARGPLTAWAVGHVVTYSNGARQHLLLNGGRFHA